MKKVFYLFFLVAIIFFLSSSLVSAVDKIRIISLTDSYPTNLSLGTNTGLYFWNSTGIFNEINYKTPDFSEYFNLILNNSQCNNNGAIVNGQMCTIPFVFHSDTDGVTTYSSLNIEYDITEVLANSIYPSDKQWFNSSEIYFNCSGSSDMELSNATIYIWSKNKSLFLTASNNLYGNENSTIINASLPSGLYHWNCLVTDIGGFNSFSYYNRTLNIDSSAPTIEFIEPTPENDSIFIKNNLSVRMIIKDELTYIKNIYFYFNGIIQNIIYYILNQFIPDSYSCTGLFSTTEPCTNAFDGNFSTRERFLDGSSGGVRSILLNYTIPEDIGGANITFRWGSFAGTTPIYACFGDFKIDYKNYTDMNEWSNLYLCKDYYPFGDPREPNCLSYPNCVVNKTISIPYDALLDDYLILNISMDYVGGGGNPLGSYLYEAQINWINSTIEFNKSLLDGNYSFYVSAEDNLGNIKNSSVRNITLIIPLITTQTLPQNNSVIGPQGEFVCNASSNLPLSNISFYLWDENNTLLKNESRSISGVSNSSAFNYTFANGGDYTWNCLFGNIYGAYSDNLNNTLIVDLTNPVINQEFPANNQHLSYKNVTLRCSVQGANISSLFLYGDFNGNFTLNQTITNISSGNTYSFNLNLNDSLHNWACAINKSDTGLLFFGQQGNYTFGIDTFKPIVAINGVSSTSGSQTISVRADSNDLNIHLCKYSIYDSDGKIDGLNQNVSYPCNNIFYATVTDYGTYELIVYGSDKAGNEDHAIATFTVSASSPATVIGGGTVTGSKTPSCNINLVRPTKKIVLTGANGEVSTKIEFIVENQGDIKDTFTFTLSDALKRNCRLKTTSVEINGKSSFTNWIQCDFKSESYAGLIEMRSSIIKCDSSLTVEVSSSLLGVVIGWFNALINGENILLFGVMVPSIVLFLGLILLMLLSAGLILFVKKIVLW